MSSYFAQPYSFGANVRTSYSRAYTGIVALLLLAAPGCSCSSRAPTPEECRIVQLAYQELEDMVARNCQHSFLSLIPGMATLTVCGCADALHNTYCEQCPRDFRDALTEFSTSVASVCAIMMSKDLDKLKEFLIKNGADASSKTEDEDVARMFDELLARALEVCQEKANTLDRVAARYGVSR